MAISRRVFLRALAALGASVVLPPQLTEAAVDEAWETLQRQPLIFEVNEFGTIVDPSVSEPQTRGDAFEDIKVAGITSIDELIAVLDQCGPLEDYVQQELENLGAISEDDWCRDWLQVQGEDALKWGRTTVQAWLDAPFDIMELAWWPPHMGSQGKALQFFESFPSAAKALGVVVIYGDHPGSSYFAAELHTPIEDANATAEQLGLPFRFRAEGA